VQGCRALVRKNAEETSSSFQGQIGAIRRAYFVISILSIWFLSRIHEAAIAAHQLNPKRAFSAYLRKPKKALTMKSLIIMTVLAASIATGASAMVNSSVNLDEIQSYAPDADVSTLTDREISVLRNVIHGGDSEGEIGSFIRSYFRKNS
jgi:hypothetical protein